MYSLNLLNNEIESGSLENLDKIAEIISNIRGNTFWALIISTAVFLVVGILIFAFLSKFVIYPINKLIESAEKITEEDQKTGKKNKAKKKTEMDNLENVLGLMTRNNTSTYDRWNYCF